MSMDKHMSIVESWVGVKPVAVTSGPPSAGTMTTEGGVVLTFLIVPRHRMSKAG